MSEGATGGWPVVLRLRGRRVVVVGGGPVGLRKARALAGQGARVVVVDPAPGDELRAAADAGALELVERPFEAEDLDDAWLAVCATGRREVDAAVAAAAEVRRVLLNAAGDADDADVVALAAVTHGDVVVAVGTGGRSPALAAHLRDQVAAVVGPEYGVVCALFAEARDECKAAGRPSGDADWRRALESGIVELVRAGRLAEAKELLRSCL